MAMSATLMRRVAPSAIAAVAIGSRRKRCEAIQSVPAPPASAARAWAGMAAIGARPSMATPNSVMPRPHRLALTRAEMAARTFSGCASTADSTVRRERRAS